MLPEDLLRVVLQSVVNSPRDAIYMRVCQEWHRIIRTECMGFHRLLAGTYISIPNSRTRMIYSHTSFTHTLLTLIAHRWQHKALQLINKFNYLGWTQCLWICAWQHNAGLSSFCRHLQHIMGQRVISYRDKKLYDMPTRNSVSFVKEKVFEMLRKGEMPYLIIDVYYLHCNGNEINHANITKLANLVRLIHEIKIPRLEECRVPIIITAHGSPEEFNRVDCAKYYITPTFDLM